MAKAKRAGPCVSEDCACDYSRGRPRCGRPGFREVWRKRADGAWYVLCYKHFIQEKRFGHLAFWGSLCPPDD